jgi:hypothetical protein
MGFYANLPFWTRLKFIHERTSARATSTLSAAVVRQERLERATLALGCLPLAMPLAGFDQQGMKLIEKPLICRQMLVKKALRGLVTVLRRNQFMPRQNTARISIGNKERLLAGIEQNGVRGFRAQASERQQLRPGRILRLCKQRVQRTLVDGVKPLDECPDRPRLLPEVPCRTNTRFKLRNRGLPQSGPAQQAGVSKARNGPGSILPCRVLGKDGAEDDLQASACRPPALAAELPKERFVVRFQHFTRLNSKRLSRALHRFEVNTGVSGKSSSGTDSQWNIHTFREWQEVLRFQIGWRTFQLA